MIGMNVLSYEQAQRLVSAVQIRCPQNKSAEGKMDLEAKLLEAKNELVYKNIINQVLGGVHKLRK